MPVTVSPQEFVAKWKHAAGNERAVAQSHFNDLCGLIGHPNPVEADPSGTWFTFEAGATKQGGGEGWADVWKKGCFAWEYKGKHANLDKAYDQLLAVQGLPGKPAAADRVRHRAHPHLHQLHQHREAGLRVTLDDLLKPESVGRLRDAFTNPDALRAAADHRAGHPAGRRRVRAAGRDPAQVGRRAASRPPTS